jgi:hypothetical protein
MLDSLMRDTHVFRFHLNSFFSSLLLIPVIPDKWRRRKAGKLGQRRGSVQHLMRQFMHKSCQGFGWLHVWKNANQSAVGHASCGVQSCRVFQLDSLGGRKN